MDEKLINKARSVAGIGSVLHDVWLSDLASMGAQDLVYIYRRPAYGLRPKTPVLSFIRRPFLSTLLKSRAVGRFV